MRARLLTNTLVIAIAAALIGTPAMAQSKKHDHKDHKHTHATAEHGGVLEDIGEYHAELVAKDGKITIYLRDEDAKVIASEPFKASVMLIAGSQRVGPIPLAPVGDNKLEGTASAIPAGGTAILTLTDKGGATAQARFKLK